MPVDESARKAGQGGKQGTGQAVKQGARQAVAAADSRYVQLLGQVGVAAIGVVHLLLAWLALQVAFGGSSGKSADQTGALSELAGNGAGRVLLGLMALGFAAWAVWQAVEAAIGFTREDGAKRAGKRIAAGAKAVIGASLTVQSITLLSGAGSSSSSSKQQDWTSTVLGWPGGRVLVVLAGLVVIGVAGYLVYDGVEGDFLDKIEGGVSQGLRTLGRSGHVARGVAYGVLGALLVAAGVKADPKQARGLDKALKTLADTPLGPWLLVAIAIGLAAFGVFNVLTASRRREP